MENGRIVVVTGGAGGIGSKIVDRFLANGDTIFAIDNRLDALKTLLETRSAQDRLVAVGGDVSKVGDTRGFADTIRAKAGRVDVLINCAGYYPIVPFEKMTFEQWQLIIAINLSGAFLMVSALLPLMKGRGWGRVVNIASASVFEGVVGQTHYVAAKSGLVGFSRSLATEVGEYGITAIRKRSNSMSDSKNGYVMKGQFTPENSALVLIDYQVGTMQLIRTSSSDVCLRNAVTLATAAKTLKMPVVLPSSQEDKIQGPISPALQRVLPDAYKARVKRQGIVNAWGDPNFSAAVAATGRKNIIMGGVTTDICLVFPSISAVHEGYNVLAVMDAGGSSYEIEEEMAQRRMMHGGVVLTTTNDGAGACAELGNSGRHGTDSVAPCFGANDAGGRLNHSGGP
jgi:NADP-dependent 3-hydroxy acid dehydrogenase YdfG/nicotinamidase-related amidase